MKLEQINQIKQTADQNEVNEHLSKGYRIIKIFSGKVTENGQEFIQPIYVLGLGEIRMVKKKWKRHWRHSGDRTPQYYCPKCKRAHSKHSNIGISHKKYSR